MFARSRAKGVVAFAPPALPGFFAPDLHPSASALCEPPTQGRTHLLGSGQSPLPRASLARLVNSESLSVARCRLRPRGGVKSLSLALLILLLAALARASAFPHVRYFGAHYRIQPLSFTSQPLHSSALLRHP